jgi:hypothetical protein
MVLGQLRESSCLTDVPRNCPNQTSIIALPVLGVNDGDHRPVVIKNQEVGYENAPAQSMDGQRVLKLRRAADSFLRPFVQRDYVLDFRRTNNET